MERFRSYQYRKLFPGVTPEQYRDIAAVDIDWDLQFARMDAEREREEIERQKKR